MKRGTTFFLKTALVVIGLIILGLCIFALPRLAGYSAETFPEYASLRYPVLIGMYATAVPFFIGVFQAWRLLQYIENNEAFSKLAVGSLGLIKVCAAVIGAMYIIGMVVLIFQNALHPGIALIGLVIVFATLVVSVFAAVLQALLKNAIEFKEENELTI
ncbi:DUF2975 domain-containing protein [Falsibacillus pallidus]|uniref:DUF2975 domain-containing protein n=1 Tax=Falsibacillus pallidus TaxID=493781 RepID=UPI003D98FECC